MSSTKVHDKSCIIGGSVFLVGFFLFRSLGWVWLSLGVYSGLLISPDWDWSNWLRGSKGYRVRIYGRVIRRWKWSGYYYHWLTVYPRIFAHRSRFTHRVVYSTILRVIWCLWPIFLLMIVPIPTLFWFIGLVMADVLHLWLDGILKIFPK